MEHLRTLTGDPDILYKHMANYALRLSSNPNGARTYVADLEEPEEDEMAPRPDGEEEEEDEPEPEPEPVPEDNEEDEGDGEEKPVVFDYTKMYFRYVSAASGVRGEDGEWVVGKKLERGEGVSFKLIDNTPQAPWVDIDNCLTYVGPERTIPVADGQDPPPPPDEEEGPQGETVAFLKGFPRVGAYFAVPIKLATGEIAGMLCMDTLKGPAGGSGRPISTEDKDLLREVAHNASVALNAAAEMRAAKLALAAEEQAAIAEALAATDDPKPELADGQEPPPDPEPEPDEPEAPQEGEDEDDAALRVNIAKTRKALEAAKANLSRKQKRFSAVDTLLDGVDDEAQRRDAPPVDAAWPLPTQELQCGGAGRSMHRQFRACRALSAARARVPWDDALAPFGSRLLLRWLGATPTPYTYTLVILRLRIRQRRIHRQVLVAEEARHIAGELAPLLARHEILREQPAALLRRQSPKITRSPV